MAPGPVLFAAAAATALLVAGVARGADAAPPTAVVTNTFAGLSVSDTSPGDPPDTALAVGPGFVVQMVNLAMRIWSTGSTPPAVVETQQLSDFFRTGADEDTDPRVIYDVPSGRWFATISTEDAGTVVLAVSRTSDPTGQWNTYSFGASGCPDQPRLGVADGVVVIGADVFTSCSSTNNAGVGAEMWIINKSQLLTGVSQPAFNVFGPRPDYATFAPVQSLSPTSTEYVVSVDQPNSGVVHLLTVDGIPPATISVQPVADIAITGLQAPPTSPDGAQQPPPTFGNPELINVNDDRILDSVWENGDLWFSANSGCTPSGNSFFRSCGRIAELSTTSRKLLWDFDIADAGAYVFFPAIRPDALGNLVVTYGESSATLNPQLRAVVRAPDGTFSAPLVVASSAGPHLSLSSRNPRFGDYFAATRDPVNPSTIWVAGEIGSTVAGGARGWTTALASVLVSGGGAPPPVVQPPPKPPRLKAHAASGHAGTVLHLTYTALDDGTGVRTQLTVRNPLSAVVYSATTVKATLKAAKLYSLPWRVRKAGRFTFCFRSVLTSGARSAQSCAIATVSR